MQRAQRDVEKLAEPQVEEIVTRSCQSFHLQDVEKGPTWFIFVFYCQTRLHRKLREKRVEALEQLKSQSEEVKNIERAIFSSGQRLGAVLKENRR